MAAIIGVSLDPLDVATVMTSMRGSLTAYSCWPASALLPPSDPATQGKEAAVITDPDGDGILADHDLCPDDPEDLDGFEDGDGCPDPDNDQDKIPDARDECLDIAETFNGCEDEDGCPDGCEPKVKILKCCMVMWPTVYFKKKSPEILVTSMPIIEETAAQLLKTPEITRILVEGMSDEMKKEADNLALSEKRAKAVADELTARGVDKDTIILAAYGDACGEKKKTKKDNRVRVMTLETAEGC